MLHLRDTAHLVLTAEGGAILDEHDGQWIDLSPLGAAAFTALLRQPTRRQAVDHLAASENGIDHDQAISTVDALTHRLTQLGLTSAPAGRPRGRPGRRGR